MTTTARAAIRRSAVGSAAILGVLLSGCSAFDESAAEAEGVGVPFGASIDEYRAAFADVDPVTLRIQVTPAEGAPENEPAQAWADSIEEWSDGKITFEWGYSDAFVPNASEVFQALDDGRIDVAPSTVPYTNPSLFPALTRVFSASVMDDNTPASQLVTPAWLTEQTLTDEEVRAEAEAAGVHFLGVRPVFGMNVLQCPDERTSLNDLHGLTSFASGPANVAQLTALGMSPSTIAYTELYESVERGIVECISLTVDTSLAFGLAPMLPYGMLSPDAVFGTFPSWWAVSEETWNSLPLAGQQLLSDRLVQVYGGDDDIPTDLAVKSGQIQQWLESSSALGGGFYELDGDATAALSAANEEILEGLRADGLDLDTVTDSQQTWTERVAELYPDLPVDLNEFVDAGGFNEVDLSPWSDLLFAEIFTAVRPG